MKGLKTPEKLKPAPKQKKPVVKKSNTNKKDNASKPEEASTNKSFTEEKKEEDLSLISRSCGIVISASKDDIAMQKLQREKNAEEAKKRAAEIFKKSQKAKEAKMKKKFKRPKRVELEGHGLSESDSD